MTEQQKILLFYALEALERTLTTDEDGDIYFNYEDYMPCTTELAKLGNEEQLRELIDKTLSQLC
jgi:hypothetical protein